MNSSCKLFLKLFQSIFSYPSIASRIWYFDWIQISYGIHKHIFKQQKNNILDCIKLYIAVLGYPFAQPK